MKEYHCTRPAQMSSLLFVFIIHKCFHGFIHVTAILLLCSLRIFIALSGILFVFMDRLNYLFLYFFCRFIVTNLIHQHYIFK